MTYGLEVLNDNGKVQIASGVSNFYLTQKGSGALASFLDGNGDISITPTAAYDAIAIRHSASVVVPKAMFPVAKASGTNQKFMFENVASGTVEWFAFRSYRALPPSPSGHGLEVFNSDGTLGFSSNEPKILKGFKIPVSGSGDHSVSVPSGRKYAFMMYGVNQSMVFIDFGGGNFVEYAYYPGAMHDTINNQIDIHWITNATNVSGLTTINGGILALDVTNY